MSRAFTVQVFDEDNTLLMGVWLDLQEAVDHANQIVVGWFVYVDEWDGEIMKQRYVRVVDSNDSWWTEDDGRTIDK